MKILMVNRVLYRRSASESIMLCLAETLQRMGHHVAFFAQDHPANPSLPDAYVISPPPQGRLQATRRLIRDKGAKKCMHDRLAADRPDLALVWQVNRSLTYSVVEALHEAGVPTWVVLTDYTPLCPARTLTWQGEPCQQCMRGSFLPCVRRRCLDDRRGRSLLGAWENRYLRLTGRYNLPQGYLAASTYHQLLLERGGFTHQPIVNVELPLPESAFAPQRTLRGAFFLYVGALVERKGLSTMLRAMSQCINGLMLVVAGDGPHLERFRRLAAQLGVESRVRFLGQLPAKSLRRVMAEALCLVVPSACEEIAPWALLEAQAIGKPAIVSDRSVLPERVTDGRSGRVFHQGDSLALAQCLDDMADLSDEAYEQMCLAAREDATRRYHPDAYAGRILALLNRG